MLGINRVSHLDSAGLQVRGGEITERFAGCAEVRGAFFRPAGGEIKSTASPYSTLEAFQDDLRASARDHRAAADLVDESAQLSRVRNGYIGDGVDLTGD